MPLNRREFLNLAAVGMATKILTSLPLAQAATKPMIKAIAFDAFPIFDPRPIFVLAEQLFPGKGAELSNVWRECMACQAVRIPTVTRFIRTVCGFLADNGRCFSVFGRDAETRFNPGKTQTTDGCLSFNSFPDDSQNHEISGFRVTHQ